MKRSILIKRLLLLVFIAAIVFPLVSIRVEASEYKIKVDGVEFSYEDTLLIHDRTYIPVRKFSELLGAEVSWNNRTKQATIVRNTTKFTLTMNEKKVIYNDQVLYMDVPTVLKDNTTYAPVRFVAEALHHKVSWDGATDTVVINSMPYYEVQAGDTLAKISEEVNLSIEDLMVWNYLKSDFLEIDQILFLEPVQFKSLDEVRSKSVIAYQDEEVEWLAKIVYSEARDEPYEGLVAVAAVVINRVQDPSFPNSIYDVIFEQNQFTPAITGRIYSVQPDKDSYRAAKEALMGYDPVEGALFFYNPNASSSSFFSKKQFIKSIGNHSFYR